MIDHVKCPGCALPLEKGYLLGKQNRIRWSSSEKGMTIFHGVPLIKLKQRFWRSLKWWLYSPSISAARCPQCQVVIFDYNNNEPENTKKERFACMIIGFVLVALGVITGTLSFYGWPASNEMSWVFQLISGLLTLILLVLGAAFVGHSFRVTGTAHD